MALLSVAVVLAVGVLLISTAEAQVSRPFTTRFTRNINGNIIAVANTLMSCPDSDPDCANARNGTGAKLSDNAFNMVYVDIDGDPTTFNSSSGQLSLFPTATILFAGLYWGGDLSAGAGGRAAPNAALRNQIKFRTPTSGGYATVTATRVDDIGSDYQGFADVTSLIPTNVTGDFTVADAQLGTGADRSGGWALVIAVANPQDPLRNLTIFDGFAEVSRQNPTVAIPVSGFQTPATGRVVTTLGLLGYEGDLSAVGDRVRLNGVDLSDGCNPRDNFFNSTICALGTHFPLKNPSYRNQLGIDGDFVDASGILQNNATSATITVATNLGSYFPGVITFATDLFVPEIDVTKAVADLNGGDLVPGDVLEYTLTVRNNGGDPATNVILREPIAQNLTFEPGSLVITDGPNAGPKSDTDGDDQASFEVGADRVSFRLGTGANGTNGGTLDPSASTTMRFRARVRPDTPDGRFITNRASVTFTGATVGVTVTINSNATDRQVVNRADLSVAKTAPATVLAGQHVTYALTVTNSGPQPATNVAVSDTLPSNATFVSATPSQGSCSGAPALTCSFGTMQSGQSATVMIVMTATAAGTLANTASVTADQADPNPGNNTASTGTTVIAEADLAITKTVSASSAQVNDTLTYTVTIRNNGPSPATNVELSETIPPGVSFVSVTMTQGTCSNTSPAICQMGSLAVNATATITAVVRADSPGPIANVATVRAEQNDPNLDNNSASAAATANAPTDPTNPAPPPADLAIAKELSGLRGLVGVHSIYTLLVDNLGPSTATGVSMVEHIPAGVTVFSVTPSQGTCSGDPEVTCSLGTVPVGGRVTVAVEVTSQRPGTFSNGASVRGNEPDPNPANNAAVRSASSRTSADLEVHKTGLPAFVNVGGTVSYFVVVRNNGPTIARDVRMTDLLPQGITPISATPSQGTCTVGTTVVCQLGSLANGHGATIGLQVTADVPGTLRNRAQVDSPDPDPVPANNASDLETTADVALSGSPVDLAVSIQPPPGPVSVGSRVTFNVAVANVSAAPTINDTLTLSLPSNATLVSLTSSVGTCTGTGIAICQIGDLGPGASATFALTVDALAVGTISVDAVTCGDLIETVVSNNRASAQVDVVGPGGPTPVPTLTPTPAPTSAILVTATPTPTPEPPPIKQGDDDTDKPPRLTEEEQQQRDRTNRAGLDGYRTEGNVVGVRCTSEQPTPDAMLDSAPDHGDGDVPYAIIVNRDGRQKVRLIGEARPTCSSIRVGDYLEADGTKQHEALFDAESVTIRRPRR